MPGLGGVRSRLTVAVLALILLATLVLGVGAAVFVDARLHTQALEAARDQAGFDLSVVVPGRQLPDQPTREDIDRSALADTFRQRGVETLVDLGGDQPPFLSNNDLAGLLERLPTSMRDLVARGQLAYAWMDIAGVPSLVVGGRPAAGGPAFYFVHDVSSVHDAIDQLRLALLLGAGFLLLLALATIRIVVRGVLRPVEEAGRIAERIERGDLSARVPVTSRDEFGTWAERFNLMAGTLADTIRRLEAAQHQNRRFVAD
ncbi:MAG TPA: HAMP domain-containing protein, partial [Methylomirabilota bacterium]|nr:HAMP domain-containing protein [Methylomirabilota bacterium]